MRKLAWILLLAVAIATPAAATDHYGSRITRKLFRGVANILLSPCELVIQSQREKAWAARQGANLNEKWAAMMSGYVLGVGYMAGRISTGAFDVATFPWPTRPLMTPGVIYDDGPHGAPSYSEFGVTKEEYGVTKEEYELRGNDRP